MTQSPDPISRLPKPASVYAHIGRLLRELRLARRLLKLVQAADRVRSDPDESGVRGGR
jgi:hypothetical protein